MKDQGIEIRERYSCLGETSGNVTVTEGWKLFFKSTVSHLLLLIENEVVKKKATLFSISISVKPIGVKIDCIIKNHKSINSASPLAILI